MERQGENGLRRWIDKAFLGSMAAIVALISVIYGMTKSDISALKQENRRTEEIRLDGFQRLSRVEVEIQAVHELLMDMKADLSEIKRDMKR